MSRPPAFEEPGAALRRPCPTTGNPDPPGPGHGPPSGPGRDGRARECGARSGGCDGSPSPPANPSDGKSAAAWPTSLRMACAGRRPGPPLRPPAHDTLARPSWWRSWRVEGRAAREEAVLVPGRVLCGCGSAGGPTVRPPAGGRAGSAERAGGPGPSVDGFGASVSAGRASGSVRSVCRDARPRGRRRPCAKVPSRGETGPSRRRVRSPAWAGHLVAVGLLDAAVASATSVSGRSRYVYV